MSSALLSGLNLVVVGATVSYIIYLAIDVTYNLYFHPLSSIPGPKVWIAFPILRHITAAHGTLEKEMKRLHEIYGEVVRFSSSEVSFITAQAWKDIYGYGHKELPKLASRDVARPIDIISAKEEDHARFRKAMSPAFSEKCLRDQEPLLNVYIDLMIEKLKDIARSGMPTDMTKWYNLITFDIIGDLAFGEPFDGLKNTRLHSWVATTFQVFKMNSLIRSLTRYPLTRKAVMLVMPRSILRAREAHAAYTKKVVMKRVHDRALHGRPDFMDSMLKHRGEKDGLTDTELVSNSAVLVLAGSETTATLLSGVTYWLLRTREALRKVTEEVREAFESETEINFTNATVRLPYMLACLEEGLRIYPPIPSGLARQTLPGAPTEISGYEVPAGTYVSVHQLAAYSSARNFHLPHSYIPERWLPSAMNDPASPFYTDSRAVLQPFSVGPRNCIGRNLAYNEMRLILVRVLWNFDLELCDESKDWCDQKTYLLWEKPPLLCKLSFREF